MSEKITAGSGERAKALFSWWKSKHPHEKKTQAALAESMGILPEVLNAKLNGKRTLTTKDAKKIADFFPGVQAVLSPLLSLADLRLCLPGLIALLHRETA